MKELVWMYPHLIMGTGFREEYIREFIFST